MSFNYKGCHLDTASFQASDRTNISNQTMELKGVKQLETFESAKNKSESVRDKSVSPDKTTEITDTFKTIASPIT